MYCPNIQFQLRHNGNTFSLMHNGSSKHPGKHASQGVCRATSRPAAGTEARSSFLALQQQGIAACHFNCETLFLSLPPPISSLPTDIIYSFKYCITNKKIKVIRHFISRKKLYCHKSSITPCCFGFIRESYYSSLGSQRQQVWRCKPNFSSTF